MEKVTKFNAVDLFLAMQQKGTAKAYRYDFNHFKTYFNIESLETEKEKIENDESLKLVELFLGFDFSSAYLEFKKYTATQRKMKMSPNTINRRVSCIKSFANFLKKAGLINYELEIQKLKAKKYRDTKGPGKETVSKVVSFQKEKLKNKKKKLSDFQKLKIYRDITLVGFSYLLGLRREELTNINLSDLNLISNIVEIDAKGRDEKAIMTIPTKLINLTKKYLELRGDFDGPLFFRLDEIPKDGKVKKLHPVSLNKIYKRLGKEVGVGKFKPHGLRHTAITEAIIAARKNDGSPDMAQSFSRHSDMNTLFLYNDEWKNFQGKQSKELSDIF